MEDPWGSPWTTNDYSPPKIDLPAPPPSAHFSASADHSPQRLTPAKTPWDDDDAWGGWNEPGKESPRWGRSPGLRPLDASGSGPASRLPSPAPSSSRDTWGHLTTLEATHRKDDRNRDSVMSLVEGVRREPSRDRYLAPRAPSVSPRESVEDIWKRPDASVSTGSLGAPINVPVIRPGSPELLPPGPAIRVDTQANGLRQSSKVQELVDMYDGMAKTSRSVSPVSPPLKETPTSPLPNGILVPQSEKLATPESQTPDSEPLTESPKELEPNMEVEEVYEKNQSPMEDLVAEEFLSTKRSSTELPAVIERPSSEPPEEIEVLNQKESGVMGEILNVDAQVKESSHSQSQVEASQAVFHEAHEESRHKPKVPSVPFSIDLSKLDHLLPAAANSFPSPEPVPDVIIDDTFASSSERKAWYLISRPGSIRKHDLGDDENYVRINWSSSHVRKEAIQIVRRWMEEDSITGRVVLGRRTGLAGTKIFNWDSSAPPVEISELFGRKSHSRQTSVASKATVPSPIAPAFGWSNSPVSSPTIAIPPPSSHISPISDPSPGVSSPSAPVAKNLQPVNPPVQTIPPLASPTSPLAQPPQTARSDGNEENSQGEEEGDDDDDWGEMVSSPTVGTNGATHFVDQVLQGIPKEKGNDTSSVTEVVTPSDSVGGTASKTSSSMADWADVPRSSFDVPPSQGLIPTSASKSSTTGWTDVNRLSMDTPASQGLLPASHSKASTVSWNSLTRASLDAVRSDEPILNKNISPVRSKGRPNSWAFGNVSFLDGAPKPPLPITDISTPARKPLSLLSKPPQVLTGDTSTGQISPTTPRKLPSPPPQDDSLKDDETVASILRDLPDLSYMLR